MIDWLFVAAVAAYATASVMLFAHLGGSPRSAGGAVAVLATALALHVAHDSVRIAVGHVGPFASVGPSLSTLAILAVSGYLGVRRVRPSVEIVGAFIAPVALLLLLGSRASGPEPVVHGTWIVVHIASNMLGMAVLTLSCAMAVAYLLQERQVKNRRLGTLFRRLPPLETLDALEYRTLVFGLPALTVGIVTGHVVAARSHHAAGLPWQQYFAMIAWAFFAAVLLLRLLAGWRGRRAAIGTLLGYASSLLVLLFYTVRAGAA